MTPLMIVFLVWVVGGILSSCYVYGSLWHMANDPMRRMHEFGTISVLFGVVGGPTLFCMLMFEKFVQHQPRYFKVPFTQ